MNKAIAVLVTYNRKLLLKESIEHLLAQSHPLDILIVDNYSTDNTKEYIQEYIDTKEILYVNTGANIGGAGGFNFGVKQAVNEGYEYIWIMDDDTMPDSDALEELMKEALRLKDFGFLCSDVRWIDGTPCNMNIPNVANKWFWHTDEIERGLLPVKQASFVSCFFKASSVKEVGLPIKDFFIWGDDAEYTKRLSDYKPSYLVTKSKVLHKMASNKATDIASESPDRLFRYQYSYRNMYYVSKMEGNKISMLLYHYGIFLDTKNILKSKQKGKWKKIRTMNKSKRAGKRFKPVIEFP